MGRCGGRKNERIENGEERREKRRITMRRRGSRRRGTRYAEERARGHRVNRGSERVLEWQSGREKPAQRLKG
jgi:hypothetical protein